ncbi:MAG: CBS domain-containing protein [Halobellus sp.]|uniref:CBS domain-containing protein n=1 Tax=Halobellus sp. TaxID=1979212 RepID=UPI0035D3E92B
MDLPTPQDLRQRRTNLDLTQSRLAEMAEVSQPLIARIEGGDVDPRLSTLRRIVNALEEAEGSVVRAADLMNETVVSVAPDDSVRFARDVMLDEGFSQLPVIRDGRPVGIISNSDIRHVQEQDDVGTLPVADVMRESVTTAEPSATLEEIDAALDHHSAVLVVEGGETVGIVTEADVAAHL